ncbi:CubicO group peptidase (beta-lactamase class C family) [Rhizobium sp. ERR 922]|nr:CubicO group peptidase (beta-lactamase class C family) [Rhizobium sp. ERR 922]TWC03870.1 CubicO group peptidase (beta-lactamase class C family) [Rhizobium sp. ERR 942]
MLAWRSFVAVLSVFLVAPIDIARAQQLQTAVPVFSATGPDAEAYGEKLGYPVGLPLSEQRNMIGNFSHADKLAPTHMIAAAEHPLPLLRAPSEISVKFTFGTETGSLSKYLDTNPTTGLLIAHNDTILFEHYQYGRTDRDRLVSQSMAKTLTAMMIGIAISEGAIHSIDDTVETYVPELKGTEMGVTPIRALLHMASGIAFTENFGNPDDNVHLSNSLLGPEKLDPITAVSRFNKRVAPPDTVWHYSNLDTEGLSLVLTHATHMSMADYLQTRIWQPMGAEASANWQVDSTGQEVGYCCFSATLRDYARFGLLLAHDGALNGRQIIPRQWLLDATEPVKQGSFLAVNHETNPWGYGYQTWLMPGPRRTFFLDGKAGQRILVDPTTHLVLVHTAVRAKPGDVGSAELVELWSGVLKQFQSN